MFDNASPLLVALLFVLGLLSWLVRAVLNYQSAVRASDGSNLANEIIAARKDSVIWAAISMVGFTLAPPLLWYAFLSG